MGRVGNVSRDLNRAKAGGGVRAARVSKKVTGNKPKRSQPRAPATRQPLVTSGRKGDPDYAKFDTVWDALGFSPQESANLATRADLMIQIARIVEENGWTQAEAAKQCRISQPRINDLLRGKIDKFSIDALINMAAALGCKVKVELEAA